MNNDESGEGRVVIFASHIRSAHTKKQVSFLFSIRQVEDIVRSVHLFPVPFSPSYVAGIANWRDRVSPALWLERVLGFHIPKQSKVRRLVMVRSHMEGQNKEMKSMIIADPPVRMVSLPIECTPAPDFSWLPRPELVRGLFEWEEGYLLVADMEKIASGAF